MSRRYAWLVLAVVMPATFVIIMELRPPQSPGEIIDTRTTGERSSLWSDGAPLAADGPVGKEGPAAPTGAAADAGTPDPG